MLSRQQKRITARRKALTLGQFLEAPGIPTIKGDQQNAKVADLIHTNHGVGKALANQRLRALPSDEASSPPMKSTTLVW